MIINLQTGEQCQATLNVEVPAEVVSSEREEIAQPIRQICPHPLGTAPGKRLAGSSKRGLRRPIREELEKRLTDSAFSEVKDKEDVHILFVKEKKAIANVDDTYTISAELLVAPTFELPEYKGVPITLPKIEVRDDHMETFVERWREQHADYEEEPEGTLIAMGALCRPGLYRHERWPAHHQ